MNLRRHFLLSVTLGLSGTCRARSWAKRAGPSSPCRAPKSSSPSRPERAPPRKRVCFHFPEGNLESKRSRKCQTDPV